MEDQHVNIGRDEEEEEEEFCSCCEDDDDDDEEAWEETEESIVESSIVELEDLKNELDEFSVKMFFKGLSIAGIENPSCGFSGIGVFMERSSGLPPIRVQKRLDFYAEEPVVDYLALMDGLLEALQNKIRSVYAFTDSELLYQITFEKALDMPLLMALRERILEHASKFETFVLKLIPSNDLEKPLELAKVAIGLVNFPVNGEKKLLKHCSICCDDKPLPIMNTLKCSHTFCSHCLRSYADSKVQCCRVPIRCPQPGCRYCISATECKSFLPFTSFESLEKALLEANDKIYCPFANCSVLLDPCECLSTTDGSSSQSDNSCVECPVCLRFICMDCGVPWHSSISCEEFQNMQEEDRDASDIALHRVARNKRWKRCQQCRRMIELTLGCYHMTCWCGHEFCYACDAEYIDGLQTCQCAYWDEDNLTHYLQDSQQWPWETSMIMGSYSDQEQSQLALIQQFLAGGGFSLGDHNNPYQYPPHCTDTYVDPMKDLHQLPWLERFVWVISDNYYEDYMQ